MIKKLLTHLVLPIAALTTAGPIQAQGINSFSTWFPTADPANALFTSSSTASTATLNAGNGTIPAGTDIGFSSVDGADASGSSSGHYFAIGSSFTLGVNYDFSSIVLPSSLAPTSGIFIGFGIGEDVAGANSAGVLLGAANGLFTTTRATAAGSRTNDANTIGSSQTGSSPTGTLLVNYDHLTNSIKVGASDSTSDDFSGAAFTHTFTSVTSGWTGKDLVASFFMRSDNPTVGGIPFPQWTGTSAEAVFSDFQVIEGAATAVPEPATSGLMLALLCSAFVVCRRRH